MDLPHASTAMLTDWEKWFFDHHGFLLLRQVVPAEDIARMIELGDGWHEMTLDELPPPLTSTALSDPKASPSLARWINHVHYAAPVFQRLVLNPQILRVVSALTRGAACLVDVALTKNYTTSDDIHFHAAGRDYRVDDGELYAGFLNAGVSLVDVPEGTGFVCLPGSHKRHFDPPEMPSIYDGAPTVANIPVQAGDCVLFTEALYHGARRWNQAYPRMSVFSRYIGEGSHRALPIEGFRQLISDEVYELEQPAVPGQRKAVIERQATAAIAPAAKT